MPPEARAWLANVAVMDLLFLGEVERARETADDEVAHVETVGDSCGAGMLFAQAAFLAYFSGDFATARDRSERAASVAHSSGDAEARARAQLVHILARRRLDRSRAQSVADLRENAAFARSAGLGVGEANALFVTAYMTLQHEDFTAAETVGAAAGTWYAPLAQVLHGLLHVLEGRPDGAEALLARAGARFATASPPWDARSTSPRPICSCIAASSTTPAGFSTDRPPRAWRQDPHCSGPGTPVPAGGWPGGAPTRRRRGRRSPSR